MSNIKMYLSYNPTIVKKKDEGEPITRFKTIELDMEDMTALREIFLNHVVSVNSWKGVDATSTWGRGGFTGYRKSENYIGMWGVVLDNDNDGMDGTKYTLEDAKKEFGNYRYVIVSSTNNNKEKPGYGIKQRFHIFLPFKIIGGEPLYKRSDEADTVYSILKEKYAHIPGAGACFDKGHPIFPFCIGENDLSNFICEVNPHGDWFEVSEDEINRKKNSNNSGRKIVKVDYISPNDYVTLPNGSEEQIKNLKVDYDHNATCYCNFCNDLTSRSASAFIGRNKFGEYFMYCSHCNRTYWEQVPKYDPEVADFHFHGSVGGVLIHKEGLPMTYCKNIGGADWISYCNENRLNPRIMVHIPRVEVVVEPYSKNGYIEDRRVFNLFKTPDALNKKYDKVSWSEFVDKCPITYSVFKNTLRDDETIQKFLEWVSYILTTRRKALTAWIISSRRQGTGKNRIVENILSPFFGEHKKQWVVTPGKKLGAEFNKSDITLWLQAYNEVWKSGNFKANLNIADDLKSLITDTDREAHFKYVDAYYVDNITNFIFMSNHRTAILIEDTDRRYNVVHMEKDESVKLNEMSWWKGYTDFCDRIDSERESFAGYMLNIKVSEDSVNTPIESYDKQVVIESSMDGFESFIKMLEEGRVDDFELDEIFPIEYNPKNKAIFDQCCEAINNHRAIPAKYLKDIVEHHWKPISRAVLISKMREFGYSNDQPRKLWGITTKVWLKK